MPRDRCHPPLWWNDSMLSSFFYISVLHFFKFSLCSRPKGPSPFLQRLMLFCLIVLCTSSFWCKIQLFSCYGLYRFPFRLSYKLFHLHSSKEKKFNHINLAFFFLTLHTEPQTADFLQVWVWLHPPPLPLLNFSTHSALLFLSSLCRWRSRWLARVRELSTLCLCLFYPLSPICETLFISVLPSG